MQLLDKRAWRALAAVAGTLLIGGCTTALPEPESAGAKLYAARCNTCHRLYSPAALKPEMWRLKVDAMQGEMARRGVPPLSTEEREVVLEYLRRNSG
jgi:mono/diheme cytochrome c family protein